MGWLRTALLCFGTASAMAAGCSDDDEPGSGGGATTTTSSGGVGGQAGAPGCSVDLVELLGSTEACSRCVNEACCEQARAYEASPSRATYFALQMCASTVEGLSPCYEQCSESVCGHEGPMDEQPPMLHECTECLTANCCGAWNSCRGSIWGDISCQTCLHFLEFTPAQCCGIPAFAAVEECLDTQCAAECTQPIWYDCSGGGWGGTGGAGGGGGAGGSAGGAGGRTGGAGGSGGAVAGGGQGG